MKSNDGTAALMKTTCRAINLSIGMVLMASGALANTIADPFAGALTSWYFGDGISSETMPLAASGSVQYQVQSSEIGARPNRRAARMTRGYFNAGPHLAVRGDKLTVYLRACDPAGRWNYGLFAQRGSDEALNYSLFSADVAGTLGPDIGFEIHTDRGSAMVSFPVSQISSTAWHALVGRYDGRTFDLICDDRVMASKSWSGNLTQSQEPTLIGAESSGGLVSNLFTGLIEEAAIWERALGDAEVATLSGRPSLAPYSPDLLHYKDPLHPIGDVHPFFNPRDGTYYVNYLYNPGSWNCAQLRSTDLIHWNACSLAHETPSAGQVIPNYFALAMINDPSAQLYRTYYGDPAGIHQSVSTDLANWELGTPWTVLPIYNSSYARQSDPNVFWNEDDQQYWMVMTLRKKNLPASKAGAVGYAVSKNLTNWIWQGELYFPGNVGDPECPSMFKMGGKWYLLASYSANMVGKPSYRVSNGPRGPWTSMSPDSLDGKDVCAAESCFDGSSRLLFGWIPLTASQPGNQYWGGHMAFPRGILSLPDGRLATFLPARIGTAIRGDQLFPAQYAQPYPLIGAWDFAAQHYTAKTASGYNVAVLPGTFDRFDFSLQVTLGPAAARAGVLLNASLSGGGVEVVFDRVGQRLLIGTLGGQVHSELPITVPAGKALTLRLIIEEDIVEVFANGQYSLAARLPARLLNATVSCFAQGGPVSFDFPELYRLKNLDQARFKQSEAQGWSCYD